LFTNLALRSFRSNIELQNYLTQKSNLSSHENRRRNITIAVIDDQAFTPQVTLQNFGYKFEPLGDIKSIDDAAKYQLILCDIKGVGRHFGASQEGSTLIQEIKRRFPDKVVIAYSASSQADKSVKLAKNLADDFISKDIDNEEWIRLLDKWSTIAVDPYEIWIRIRSRLAESRIDTKQIIYLEDRYVRSVLDRDPSMSKLEKAVAGSNLPADARAIIQGLISSLIFRVLIG